MVARKEAVHCRNHVTHTPEWIEKIASKNRGRTLSLDVRRKISSARTGKGDIIRTCPLCNKTFSVLKPSSKVRFCSRQCGYIQRRGDKAPVWRKDMPIVSCRVCGKSVRSPAITVKRYTCSYTCKAIWQLTHQKNTGTDIEVLMEKALKFFGYQYKPQYNLCNVTVADFYLSSAMVIIGIAFQIKLKGISVKLKY
jgi:endogenous inhibitor of DNA gyrase (YacG/DUF329 family)